MLFLAISLQYRLFVCASLFGFRDQTNVFFFVQCHKLTAQVSQCVLTTPSDALSLRSFAN